MFKLCKDILIGWTVWSTSINVFLMECTRQLIIKECGYAYKSRTWQIGILQHSGVCLDHAKKKGRKKSDMTPEKQLFLLINLRL